MKSNVALSFWVEAIVAKFASVKIVAVPQSNPAP